MGAPDFSRSSFTSLALIFSLTVVISLFPISAWFQPDGSRHKKSVALYRRGHACLSMRTGVRKKD
jgi:hypothetical protein